MPKITSTTENTFLSGSSDFKFWYDAVKRRARTSGIWKYVDPEADPPATLEEPPENPASNNQAALIFWQEKQRKHPKTEKALNRLEDYIFETVDSRLLRTLRDVDTVAAQLKIL